MTAWLLAAGTALVAGLAATWFLYRKRLPRERRIAGRALLKAMDQGDFMQLVLAVLNGRGYERAFGGSGTEGEYLLERNGQAWLLSSRHSRAWRPGSTAIAEFANHLRHSGIPGGVLAIPGRFPRAAHGVARAHRVELLDADTMWAELQPLLDEDQHAAIDRPARARLHWQFVLAWLAAVAIGAVVFLTQRQAADALGDEAAPAAASPPAARAPAQAPAASPPAAAAMPADPAEAALPAMAAFDPEAEVGERRRALAEAIARLPHVESAHWPAPSTLQVVVDSELFDPRARLCPLLEPDPELRASRLQVQYPAGSQRPVRFLQCRAY